MNRFLLTILALATSSILLSQPLIENRCPYKGIQITDNRILKEVDDFTITTTDGITRNLYNTLDSGKTISTDELSNGSYFIRLTQNNRYLDTQKAWISK